MARQPSFPGPSDHERLQQFICWVHDFLGDIVEFGRSPTGQEIFAEELLEPMRAAWSDVESDFHRLSNSVADIPPERMREHGLIGSQLKFKLATVTWRWRLFQARGRTPLFRRLLNTIDTLLNSILSAVGSGTAISEIKDAIRDASKGPDES